MTAELYKMEDAMSGGTNLCYTSYRLITETVEKWLIELIKVKPDMADKTSTKAGDTLNV